jgi:hypothetical protein
MNTITQEQYSLIVEVLPVQRGNVRAPNLTFLNAILYIAENGGNSPRNSARGLPFINA